MAVNTILAANTGAMQGTTGIVPCDGSGPLLSQGFNLVGTTSGLSNFLSTDLLNVNPHLGPIQDNGGLTPTHALLSSSPAIDAGTSGGYLLDQRGQPRSIDNPVITNRPGGDGTDIGALEVDHILKITAFDKFSGYENLSFTSVSDKRYGLDFNNDKLRKQRFDSASPRFRL